MTHVIDKLTFEMACADEQQAFKIREDFINDLYDEMVAVIETCCNHVTDKEQLLEIQKLEINLGQFKSNLFDKKQYIKVFGEAFEKELKKRLPQINKAETIQQSHVEILICFLETGSLPWWAIEMEVDLNNWCSEIINGLGSSGFLSWLQENRLQPEIWQRIVSQLNPEFKNYIISKILPLLTVAEKLSVLYKEYIETQGRTSIRTIHQEGIVQDFVLRNGSRILSNQPIPEDGLFKEFISTEFPENNRKDLRIYKGGDQGNNKLRDFDKNKIEPIPNATIKNNNITQAEPQRKMMVRNAGIILLTPFLNKFYANLGLWKDGRWASEEARCKAVYLLHYLGTGKISAFEYQLVLEKVICGISLSETLDRAVALSKSETEEADDLLVSVIQHWVALKNTSVEGLCNSFLQREGLLSGKEDNWLLQIERKTMDVLLEQLPWGYATVSLPWNKYLIFTEW